MTLSPMGVPKVIPCSVPDWISTRSFSSLGVDMALWPGRRRVNWGWISASVSSRSGGTPSMIAPTDLQWLSPYLEELVYRRPIEFVHVLRVYFEVLSKSWHGEWLMWEKDTLRNFIYKPGWLRFPISGSSGSMTDLVQGGLCGLITSHYSSPHYTFYTTSSRFN